MSPQLHRCTLCDSTVQSTGRVGHLKFTSDDAHGPKQKMPEDYDDNPDDYFVPVDTESEAGDSGNSDSPEGGENTPNDETPTSDITDPDSDKEVEVEPADDADESDETLAEKIRRFFLTPIDEL